MELCETKRAESESIIFVGDGFIPNSHLPTVIYRKSFDANPTGGRQFLVGMLRMVTVENMWLHERTYDINRTLHYHSTAHNAFAVICGSATVEIGGPVVGENFVFSAGDFVILPAGVGNRCVRRDKTFMSMGFYPFGQKWDMCWGLKRERAPALHNIKRVPLPKKDPLYGDSGDLLKLWT